MSDFLQHQPEAGLFYIDSEGQRSELRYRKINENTLDYYSTYVPDELRGKGIAQKLAQGALDHAQKNGLKVTPSCWYVAKYIEKNPQYKSLLSFSD